MYSFFLNIQKSKKIKQMKKRFKIILVITSIGVGGLAYIWFFVYNKPHRDIEKSTPDFVISSSECYNHYAHGNNTDLKNFTGKILQIKGVPTSIESNDSLVVIVFVFNEGMFGDEGIRCTMLETHAKGAQNTDLSKSVIIKGYCSGFNEADVILEQCSIISSK